LELNDIIGALRALGADVILIEMARFRMDLPKAFERPLSDQDRSRNHDIQALRCPEVSEMVARF
jgi:hypothetical protein